MKRLLIAFLGFCSIIPAQGQFAPRNGWPGSTAISKDSSVFVAWAVSVQEERGWKDIRYPDSGKVSVGLPDMTTGKADGQCLSLGDGGMAVLHLDPPVVDGPGADFAVFENGFHIHPNSDSDFLELAFVEVSSDGQHWVRFPAQSLNDTIQQLNSFDGMRAHLVHNLAGKYTGGFGVPFDLSDLEDSSGIDLMNISYIRVIDVVGSLEDSLCSRDAFGRKINDPFPTPFNQGGFDLDAIGVIHNLSNPSGITEHSLFHPYPNPSKAGDGIIVAPEGNRAEWEIYSAQGAMLERGQGRIAGAGLSAGVYHCQVWMDGKPYRFLWLVI